MTAWVSELSGEIRVLLDGLSMLRPRRIDLGSRSAERSSSGRSDSPSLLSRWSHSICWDYVAREVPSIPLCGQAVDCASGSYIEPSTAAEL